jgi:hypothetical protein
MSKWSRATAGFTAALMLWSSVLSVSAAYAEEPNEGEVVRTIVGRDSNGWAVVDIRTVTGQVVILSPVVGRGIDLDESIKFSMFQGPSEFNRRAPIPVLAASVPGFKEALFIKRGEDRYGVRIKFSSANKTKFRTLSLNETDVKRIREYVENFAEIQRGEYKIHRSDTKIEDVAEYPKLTDEAVSFETRVPRFVLARRVNGQVTLTDGLEIRGELVPVFDEGSILIDVDFATRSVPVDDIHRIRTSGNKSSSALRGAVRTGIGSALSGALTGALAAWQSNADVKEWTVFGTIFFGAAGFLTGLATGIGSGASSEDFVLGPLGKSGKGE